MRILIVDDDEMALAILDHTLHQAGYETQIALDGDEAMEHLHRGTCQLVISDWQMPRMNGVELCRAIRAAYFPAYIYIILLTAHNSRRETIQGLSAGADDFVAKPFDSGELLARVRAGERILSLDTRDMTIFALAKLAESRDRETGNHLQRVQNYCRVLAQELARSGRFKEIIDGNYIRLLYQTSPLHDIGKVGIPDAVLLKPGQLTDKEFEVMKTHTIIGADALEAALERFPMVRFLQMARDIALSHHERYDGAGYPAGLACDQIPLCARIVAVADVYDALTSKRVYKEPFSHAAARSILLEGSGRHFDPRVVEAFIAAEQQFIAIYDRFGRESLALTRREMRVNDGNTSN